MERDTITISRAEYEALVDARDHAIAMRDVATGALATLPDAEMDAYLASPSPLAFWRERENLTQATLAARAGISLQSLAHIESAKGGGDVQIFAKLAKALRVRIEDLLPDEPEPS